jgi:hypothetical protein
MTGFFKDPPRLKEKHDQSNLAERIAGQAFRDMAPAAPLSSTALARIAARVEERASLPGSRRRLRWAFVCCAFLLGGATVASAQRLDLLPRWLSRLVAPKSEPVSHQQYATVVSRQGRATRRTDELPATPVQADGDRTKAEFSAPAAGREPPVANLDRSKPVGPMTSGSREARRSVPGENRSLRTVTTPLKMGVPPVAATAESVAAPSIESRPAPAPSPATVEHGLHLALVEPKGVSSALAKALPAARPTVDPSKPASTAGAQHAAKVLGLAIRALRVEHSPQNALALLDRHSAELHRAFAHESLLLRVEAMLALGQKSQVLWLLDETSLSDVAPSRALLVTRGQLRTAANRCSEAIGDFDRVLAGDGQPSKQALQGRALCRDRLGDTVGAQLDRQRVRHEFPDDPAAEAAQ